MKIDVKKCEEEAKVIRVGNKVFTKEEQEEILRA